MANPPISAPSSKVAPILSVSVLIDTYNHERFIEKAIHSVLEQDFPAAEREIIVVDDGSTDRTPEIVQRFEPNLRYIRKENGGQASAFNIGIPECRGEIIAFLDGDDYWLPGKLSRVAEVLEKNSTVGFVGHAIKESLPDGHERISAPAQDEKFQIQSVESGRLFRLRKSFLGTSRMTMRAEIARRILPVPESLVFEADEYLFTLAAAMSEIVILRKALTCYVIHGSNLYVSAGSGKAGLRRKQQVMAALASCLRVGLRAQGLAADIVDCVVEIVQAEADQFRLMLDGGAPWQTVRAENKLFKMLHGDASRSQTVFRALSMIPALLLPPRWFYAGRQWVSKQSWYRKMRQEALPVARIAAVTTSEESKI
ncbi:MAG TPA: glycosyltransferase [Verrucomicrobiae bacterium]|nr:glycosyltransferase [Verrucomicrobiae bacterium]